ncbi:MAG: hypothetical protein ACQEXV_02850 [Bacillota bacterium]
MKVVNAVFGVHIHQHVYWKRKESFQLAFDTDAHWIAYVIEEGKFAYTIKEHRGQANAGSLILCPPEEVFHRKILTPLSFHFFRFSFPEASSIGASIHAVLDKEDEDRFLSNCRIYVRTRWMIAAMPKHGKIICWRICFFCFGAEPAEGHGGTYESGE